MRAAAAAAGTEAQAAPVEAAVAAAAGTAEDRAAEAASAVVPAVVPRVVPAAALAVDRAVPAEEAVLPRAEMRRGERRMRLARRFVPALMGVLALVCAACSPDEGTSVLADASSPAATPAPITEQPTATAPASPPPTTAPPSPTKASPSPSPSPKPKKPVHDIKGWLHVDGRKILDEQGHPVRLFSIGVVGMDHGFGLRDEETGRGDCKGWKEPPPQAYDQIDSWRFNSVRLSIAWAPLEPGPPTESGGKVVHAYNPEYVAALDRIVKNFTKKGVAVILDMHQVRWSPAFRKIEVYGGAKLCAGTGMPKWLYAGGGIYEMVEAERSFFTTDTRAQEWFIDAWEFLVARYRQNPLVVGVDMLAEPYDLLTAPYPGVEGLRAEDLDLAGFYERVANAIRKVNPKLLLIYEENISRRTGSFSFHRKPQIPNGVYSIHFYAETWAGDGDKRMAAHERRTRQWNVPFWVGEFRTFGYTFRAQPYPNWRADTEAFLAYCKEHDIGWTIWRYNEDQFPYHEPGTAMPELLAAISTGY